MKLTEISQSPLTVAPATKLFLDKSCHSDRWSINEDGMIDVRGDVTIYPEIRVLPVPFGTVTGNFECYHGKLESLTDAPHTVIGNFTTNDCKNLKSLDGLRGIRVGGDFDLRGSEITSLHGIHKHVKQVTGAMYISAIQDSLLGLCLIEGLHEVWLDGVEGGLSDLVYDYMAKEDHDINEFQELLIDAGYPKHARL